MSRAAAPKRTAILVVDCQVDFCEGGSLAVAGGTAAVEAITAYLTGPGGGGGLVVTTQDWHVDPVGHFAADGEVPDHRVTWPRHCVAGTPGAALHPALRVGAAAVGIRKGEHRAAYSGFEGHAEDGRSLDRVLRGAGVTAVDVCGIATDHCVRATALDAVHHGYATRVLLPLCAGVDPQSTAAALAELRSAGVEVVDHL